MCCSIVLRKEWELYIEKERPMALINFDEALWGSVEGIELCDAGEPGNTLTDPSLGISFIIAEGSMEVMRSSGNRFLFFSCVDCSDTVHATTTLVIRFDTPHQYVRFRIYPDPVGSAIMVVNYYREYGATDLLDSRSVPIAYMTPAEIVYSSSEPIRELTIRTEAAENRLYEIEFYESIAEIGHDVALVLDGSGSMGSQNKWGAMIEAADIFYDLYAEFGGPTDGFGAVRFRWECTETLAGDQTTAQPSFNQLSVPVDIPALYASDSPDGCTPIGEGIIRAAGMVAGGGNLSKHLLLLTDGKNNRGRTVTAASGDTALDGVTVHTLGLGSGVHIDPVEIGAIVTDHGGVFRQTVHTSEVLDFFAQTLGDMLGKVESAVITDDTATIAPGTSKAVFLIAWDDPAVSYDFDLIAPSGDVVDHSSLPTLPGITISYFPKTTGNAHAYFVVEGDVEGVWQFHNRPTDVHAIALEDLELRIQWVVTPQLGFTGRPIDLEARITYRGRPYEGKVSVTATVTRPDEAQGDLLAKDLRKKPVPTQPAGDSSQRSQIISAVLGRYERQDFLFKSIPGLAFERVESGSYRLKFTDTDNDGVYRFDLKAEGRDEKGNLLFARRSTRFCTLIQDIDGDRTETQIELLEKDLYRVVVTPMTKTGNYIGPFLADHLSVQSTQGKRVGRLRDNLDGSYTQLIQTRGAVPRDISIGVLNMSVPIGGVSSQPTDRLPWILVIILLVLLILFWLL